MNTPNIAKIPFEYTSVHKVFDKGCVRTASNWKMPTYSPAPQDSVCCGKPKPTQEP